MRRDIKPATVVAASILIHCASRGTIRERLDVDQAGISFVTLAVAGLLPRAASWEGMISLVQVAVSAPSLVILWFSATVTTDRQNYCVPGRRV